FFFSATFTTQLYSLSLHDALPISAFVNMIRKHYPSLMKNVSTTVSPMCALSRLLKATDPEVVTVFIGPCFAKKSEVVEFGIEGKDRKSTRLNSSHVSISYAVFCLK